MRPRPGSDGYLPDAEWEPAGGSGFRGITLAEHMALPPEARSRMPLIIEDQEARQKAAEQAGRGDRNA